MADLLMTGEKDTMHYTFCIRFVNYFSAGMDINQNLVSLERSGMIRLVTAQPEIEYLFTHTLFHDAAYKSILKKDRKALHLYVGQLLETLYPDRLEELAPVLGNHFREGGDPKRAVHYLKWAADHAFAKYANIEAASLYAVTLDLVKRDPQRQTGEVVYLYLRRGRALELTGEYSQALALYLEMEEEAKSRSDPRLQLAAQIARMIILSIQSQAFDPEAAYQLGLQSLPLARQLGDRAAEAKLLWCMMLANAFRNQSGEAREVGEKSLSIAREIGSREQTAYTLNDLGSYVYSGLAKYQDSLNALEEARPIWVELGDLPMQTDNFNNTAFRLYVAGEYGHALENTAQADRISMPHNFIWSQAFSSGVRGIILLETGRIEQAIQELERAISLGEKGGFAGGKVISRSYLSFLAYYLGPGISKGPLKQDDVDLSANFFPFWTPQALACLAYQNLVQGDRLKAKSLIDEAEKIARRETVQWFASLLPVVRCEYWLACHQPEAIIDFLRRSLTNLEGGMADTLLAYACFYLGAAYLSLDQLDEAQEHLSRTAAMCEQAGMVHVLWRSKSKLGEIASRRGFNEEALRYREEAMQTIRWIANQIGDPDLIQSFYQNPEIRANLVR
jgi:tetratricopeptide (TPR) repeat protein